MSAARIAEILRFMVDRASPHGNTAPGRRARPDPHHPSFPLRPEAGATGSGVRLAFQRRLLFDAIVPGETAQQRATDPVLQGTAEVFPGHPRHRRQIALADLVTDEDTA